MSQQYQPQFMYQQPPRGNGFGVAAMVLGIIAVVLAFIPILGVGGFVLGLLAMVFAIVGLTRTNRPKGTSIAGLVLALVAMLLAALITVFFVNAFSEVAESGPAPVEDGSNVVVYEVTSDAPTIGNVTYMTFNNGGSGMEQATDTAAPFSKEIDLGAQGVFDSNLFSLTGQSGAGATMISCKITLNGEVISEQTSTGEYSLVSCSESRF